MVKEKCPVCGAPRERQYVFGSRSEIIQPCRYCGEPGQAKRVADMGQPYSEEVVGIDYHSNGLVIETVKRIYWRNTIINAKRAGHLENLIPR